jgi:hypothetical protein
MKMLNDLPYLFIHFLWDLPLLKDAALMSLFIFKTTKALFYTGKMPSQKVPAKATVVVLDLAPWEAESVFLVVCDPSANEL